LHTPTTFYGLGEIVAFALWMQKQGYRESTIRSSVSALKSVARNANLLNPDDVKGYLARLSGFHFRGRVSFLTRPTIAGARKYATKRVEKKV